MEKMNLCLVLAFLGTLALACANLESHPQYKSSIFRNISTSDIVKVPVKRVIHRVRRSSNSESYHHELKFSAFGQDFSLYLEPAGHVLLGTNTKVYKASSNYGGNVRYNDLGDILTQLKYRPLQDPDNNAAAIEFEGPNGPQVEGFLNDTYIFSTDDDDNDDDINVARIPDYNSGDLSNDFKDFDFSNFPNFPTYPPSKPNYNDYNTNFPNHPSSSDFNDYHPNFPNHPSSSSDFNDYHPNFPNHPSSSDFNDYHPNFPNHPSSSSDFNDYHPNAPNYPSSNPGFNDYNPSFPSSFPNYAPDSEPTHWNTQGDYGSTGGDSSTFWGNSPSSYHDYKPNSVNGFNNAWNPIYDGYNHHSSKGSSPKASRKVSNPTNEETGKDHKEQNAKIVHRLALPDTVYMEILVVLDDSFYSEFNGNAKDIVKYAAGFWNAVDLRFRQLSNPRIRLSIKGIVIASDPGATPYIVIRNGNIHGESTLNEMVETDITQRLPPVSYDILMAMTKRPMYGENGPGQVIAADGFAFLGSACIGTSHYPRTIDFEIEFPSSFGYDSNRRTGGIIRDLGLYTGTSTAAHEMAHMLGARHDREESEKQRMSCPEEAGFIMNAGGQLIPNAGINRWRFSPCSHAAIREFFRSGKGECLYNKPSVGTPIDKPLPGIQTSLTEQCQSVFGVGARASRSGNSACEMLFCVKGGHSEELCTYEPPAEGSACEKGTNKLCINGRCVPKPEEVNRK